MFINQISEGKNEFLRKFADEPGVQDVVKTFWDVVRKRVQAPKNDIDWWINKPYSDFKEFVTGFDTKSRSVRRSDEHARKAELCGAFMAFEHRGYEVWYVPTYEAARELGRFYKGVSAKWCISTDNPEYFTQTYADSEFVFLIATRTTEAHDEGFEADKFALQIDSYDAANSDVSSSSQYSLWDTVDDDVTKFDEYDGSWLETVVSQILDMYNDKIGMNRSKYIETSAKKLVTNREWLLSNLFSNENGVTDVKFEGDTVSFKTKEDILEYIIEEDDGNSMSISFIRNLILGDYHECFGDWNFAPSSINDLPKKALAAFDVKLRRYGITHRDIAEIWNNNEPEHLSDYIIAWISSALDDDFYNGNSFLTYYHDCSVNGTAAEAHDELMQGLRRLFGVTHADYFYDREHDSGVILTCTFNKDMVYESIKGQLHAGGGKNPLEYLHYDTDMNEVVKSAIHYSDYSGFDDDMMIEAMSGFADNLIAELTRQKDADGQMFFDFDKDYNTNPTNRRN